MGEENERTMKKIISLFVLLLPYIIKAQSVAINNDNSQPHNTAILDVKSDTKGVLIPRITSFQRTSIVSPAIGLTVFDTDTYSFWMFRGDVMGGWVEGLHSLDKHWNRTGANIFTTNPGNVGIGTNNPSDKLSINATDPTISLLNAGIAKGFVQSNGNHIKIGTYNTNTSGSLVFNTRGNDRIFITPSGDIGIGISDPAGKFQIIGGTEASLATNGYFMLGAENGYNLVFDNNEMMARNNGAAAHLYLQNEGGNVFIGDPADFTSSHRLGVNGNTVITGNLRVGTTVTPSGYKLAVDGKAICTELLVRLVPNWPDYVFNKNYKLRTIEEMEEFVRKNHHLPGIPSAKSIETNGLSVGEMQKLQMEKIEELALYIIELKKEIETLKAKK